MDTLISILVFLALVAGIGALAYWLARNFLLAGFGVLLGLFLFFWFGDDIIDRLTGDDDPPKTRVERCMDEFDATQAECERLIATLTGSATTAPATTSSPAAGTGTGSGTGQGQTPSGTGTGAGAGSGGTTQYGQAVTSGTLDQNTIAVTEMVHRNQKRIEVFGGSLTGNFQVAQDRNAWRPYRDAAHAADEAVGQARARCNSAEYSGWTVIANGTTVCSAPAAGTGGTGGQTTGGSGGQTQEQACKARNGAWDGTICVIQNPGLGSNGDRPTAEHIGLFRFGSPRPNLEPLQANQLYVVHGDILRNGQCQFRVIKPGDKLDIGGGTVQVYRLTGGTDEGILADVGERKLEAEAGAPNKRCDNIPAVR